MRQAMLLLPLLLSCALVLVTGVVRDLCQVKPSTSSFCAPLTVGIFFDPETQHCRYMGCSERKLFATVEDCEKICNNERHRRRRMQAQSNKTLNATEN